MPNPPIDPAALKERFKLTELGNAERLVTRYGTTLRYCHAWKKWLVWDEKRWKIDDKGAVEQQAQRTVRAINEESERADEDAKAAIEQHGKRSESKYKIDAMISLARSQALIPVSPREFDSDPLIFNCENGLLDLRTGELREHGPGRLIINLAPVKYDLQATCRTWLSFLDRIFGGDVQLIEYVRRVIGYSLTGCVTEKALFVLHGGGDNGKTTLLEAVRNVMGDYAAVIEIDSLMRNGSDTTTERAIAELCGKRFVTASEAEEGQKLREAKLKQLTGMGRLVGRKIYGSPFEFDPSFKLFIDANHKPVIRGNDKAIWNRIRLIPFDVSIPKADQDPKLGEKLRAEAPGILAWAVEGCLKWQHDGLCEPTAVTEARGQYRDEMDVVADFIADCCTLGPEGKEVAGELYAAYQRWSENLREAPISSTAFGSRLTAKGFEGDRSSGLRYRRGLTLRHAPAAPNHDGQHAG
jgi:putative DNA primase/helicase